MDVVLVSGAKLVVDDSNAMPDVGVQIRIHGFGEHIKSLEFSKLVGCPCVEASKGELSWVRIDIDGVSDISWFHGRLEIVGAVKTKANDERLGCKSER